MNNIEHLRDTGIGRRVFLIGNGPSLADLDLDLLVGEDTIAMNRIDLLYSSTTWRPTYYLFSSTNVENYFWGTHWAHSVLTAAAEPATTALLWSRYRDLLGLYARSWEMDPPEAIWLDSLSESEIGTPEQFSTDAVARLDKSGTTMNLALQLAYFMRYDATYLLGCDSNWQTATDTTRTGDPNHFNPNYHAHIADGAHEFWRMNTTHKIAREHFDAAGLAIFNATPGSAIDAYERRDLAEILKGDNVANA